MRAFAGLGIFFALASCGADSAVPAQKVDTVVIECGDKKNDMEISACLEEQVEKSGQRVQNALKRNFQEAAEADKDRVEFEGKESAIDRNIHVKALKASQAAWEKYTDAHCTLESYTALRGTAQHHFYLMCLDRLNLQRIHDLRSPFTLESQRLQPVPEE